MGASIIKETGVAGPTAFIVAIALSIPAVVLFAFGQLVGDIRAMSKTSKAHGVCLEALQSYRKESKGS
jgi:hypothetical protein